MRVLIVEDNIGVAKSLAAVVRQMGHEVHHVSHPIIAVEAARAFKPDVMLIDIGLPGIDGWRLAQMVRRHADLRHITLYAHSELGTAHDRQRSLVAGFDDHLSKPIDLARLEKLLSSP